MRMARPVGVTIIAVCCFLAALYGALSGIRLIAKVFMTSNSGATSGVAELGAILILDLIIFTVLYALAGWGLWKLKRWGCWVAIFLGAVGSTYRLLLWFLTSHHTISDLLTIGSSVAIYGAIIAYLFKDEVKTAFATS